ncbi:hypothetical protein EZ449_15455 [Pedobacter frigidisoli]|uniref:Uncharacterized protein n=1 Tax=Pedobacter frigidisoli TaxID=2530455 RepID=A0A4R0NZJ7_9SPHI|nr:hypothetical protein [Pedobacter frigidisoli]TCD05859.1 hypothetical protein EZ449_15455 [Pedobacter frigidisoli]
MNKVQKMIMSFAAVAMIVSFSAFKPSGNAKLLTYRYANIDGKYQLRPIANPDLGCSTSSTVHCVITTDVDKGSEFPYSELPGDWQPVGTSSLAIFEE